MLEEARQLVERGHAPSGLFEDLGLSVVNSTKRVPSTYLAMELLERSPDPTEAEIRDMLSGILDRETAYVKPVEAVRRAAALLRGDEDVIAQLHDADVGGHGHPAGRHKHATAAATA